jgi:hypothetical protein
MLSADSPVIKADRPCVVCRSAGTFRSALEDVPLCPLCSRAVSAELIEFLSARAAFPNDSARVDYLELDAAWAAVRGAMHAFARALDRRHHAIRLELGLRVDEPGPAFANAETLLDYAWFERPFQALLDDLAAEDARYRRLREHLGDDDRATTPRSRRRR